MKLLDTLKCHWPFGLVASMLGLVIYSISTLVDMIDANWSLRGSFFSIVLSFIIYIVLKAIWSE
ncbi:hypothetical protein LCGC14_1544850 [marine sediment metagenome]|uniref:Uncharacterized protein n=1 Tax=marine sediment metagenome TaxID=412755 RepID=A0A0F9LSR3_9ZZZZ